MNDRPRARVLVADDHPVFRRGLAALLGEHDAIELIGEVGTCQAAIELVTTQAPDVVLMDIALPDGDGIDLTGRIVAEHPHVAVLMLSMYDDDQSVLAAMRAGARGYLPKETSADDVVRAVLSIASGQVVFGSRVAHVVQQMMAESRPGESVFPELTTREREVLELIAQGRTNAEIGQDLGITAKTARNHAYNIFMKMQVTHRAQAIIRAREAGLG